MDPTSAHRADTPDHVGALLAALAEAPTPSVASLAAVVADVLEATSSRLLIADYALRSLRPLEPDGARSDSIEVEGTMAGRCFATGETIVHRHADDSSDRPTDTPASTVVWVPLTDGIERLGVLELAYGNATELPRELADVTRVLVLALISRRRYTDVLLRARRSQPLTEAAEAQWDLLPPLAHAMRGAAVCGAVEPAYDIGGDSFDYAFNPGVLQFAILDAAGHGIDAVLMSAAAIHCLRNARRSFASLEETYERIDARIAKQFGQSFYVTGQLGWLDLATGRLTWLNAGHVRPLHVRDQSFIGELECQPSKPMGLGGTVREVMDVQLQPGDRILFYTDGVTESRAPDNSLFGGDRLADFLVRATIDQVSVTETVRRLTANVVAHVDGRLRDDATMFLVEYSGVQPV